MKHYQKELDPVIYDFSAVKIRSFSADLPGQEYFRMHWHERMELLRIRQGSMIIDFGTSQKEVAAGSLVIIPPNQPHSGIIGVSPLQYDMLMFDIRLFYNETATCKQIFPAIFDGSIRFTTSTDTPVVLDCVDSIIADATHDKNALTITARIYTLMALLYDNCLAAISPAISFDNGIKEIINYMEANFQTDLTIDKLCKKFKYAKPYFCSKFKENTGLTPMNYLKAFRIEKAYELLKEGNHTVNEIAGICGFSDSNYFTRCFKNHFGHPPSYFKFSKRMR